MRKITRILPLVVTTLALLLVCLFPVTARAATNFTPADGASFDLAACSSGDTITIAAGTTVNVTNLSRIPTLTNFQIICEAGSHLTLQVITIDNSAYPGLSPVTFTGTGTRSQYRAVIRLY